jgi:hypothetical protein
MAAVSEVADEVLAFGTLLPKLTANRLKSWTSTD